MLPTQFFPAWPGTNNTALDAMFYDVGILSEPEKSKLSARGAAEGMILEVGPSTRPTLRVWSRLSECEDLAPHYPAITVAGVGSSSIGAAALARNTANAYGGPVLAVISGYGMSDLTAEALGGYFVFGGLNAMRHALQTAILWPGLLPGGMQTIDPGQTFQLAKHSKDVAALTELLSGSVTTDWLVGHSKGNLVISEALYALRADSPQPFETVARETGIVTFGARIAMPPEIANVIDVMGELDNFGALNSRPDIPVDISVPGAWHHTNTQLPWHVPVTKVLEGVLGRQ